MDKKREVWIDYLKVFACVLVVLGHFFQSMVEASIIKANDLYSWFNITIYYFHVPLFFICSGYLYSKTCEINSLLDWWKNIIKKLIVLGVPYLAFSTMTWILKTVFSNSVNTQIDGLVEILVLHPTSPYWYLYCLILLFIVTPFNKKNTSWKIVFVLAILGKILSCYGIAVGVYAIDTILANEIWFVIGIMLTVFSENLKVFNTANAMLLGVLFLILSKIVYCLDIQSGYISFGLGVLACFSCVTFFRLRVNHEKKFLAFVSKYTMSIFLMHTIFAAAMRIALLKIGVYNSIIHMIMGIGISFVGPIVATKIMRKFAWMEFFINPGKYIKAK